MKIQRHGNLVKDPNIKVGSDPIQKFEDYTKRTELWDQFPQSSFLFQEN